MPEGFDSSAAIAAACAGDESAAAALLEHWHPLVARLVRAYRSRSIGHEDLIQEVLMRAFTKLHTYRHRPGTPPEHWLCRLAGNTCRNVLRDESRRPRLAQLSEDAVGLLDHLATGREPPVDDALAARELVEQLLDALPPRDRAILTLIDREGRSVKEVATLTGMGQSAVKVRAFRARRKLRAVAEALREDGR